MPDIDGVDIINDFRKFSDIPILVVSARDKDKEKDIYIVLSEHADNALIFTFRMPVNTTNYWDARFEVLEQVKKAFDEEGISIPYPQLDVHLDK